MKADRIKLDDCYKEVLNLRGSQFNRGLYVGFPKLHDFYSVVDGSSTDVTGSPTAGKTEFVLELLINLAQFYGKKSTLYVPDLGSPEEVYVELLQKYTKKSFSSTYTKNGQTFENKNYISETDIARSRSFIEGHFEVLQYKERPAPKQFYDDFARLRIDEGYFNCLVDSWKDLKIDHSVRADLFLDDCLTYRNSLMQRIGGHMWTIIHPLKTEKDANGNYKPVDAYGLKGGTSWYDNGKSMLSLNRPDPFDNRVDLYVLKAKPKPVGIKGWHEWLHFDISTKRYYENLNGKRYASMDDTIEGNNEIDFLEVPF